MDYSIEAWKGGRWVIVAEGDRHIVICASQEQAQRLLTKVKGRAPTAGNNDTRPTNRSPDTR